MSLQPLTHHEIIALVEPFSRSGRRVDLAASDRLERRLVFQTVDHAGDRAAAADSLAAAELRETWQLEPGTSKPYRLTRTVRIACGANAKSNASPNASLHATLHAEGKHPGDLLARMATVPLRCQFRQQAGWCIAESHRLDVSASTMSTTASTTMSIAESTTASTAGPTATAAIHFDAPVEAAPLILTSATAQVDGLLLTLTVPSLSGIPAEIELQPAANQPCALPDDLLAVLGWSWTRLIRVSSGWQGQLRLRGKGAARSRDAEIKFVHTVAHVARTVATPPTAFHERWRARRWRVTLRRAVPLLVTAGLIGGAAAVPTLGLSESSLLRLVAFQFPPLLLGLVFCMRELPQIEIPPWPRRLAASAWTCGAVPGLQPVQDASIHPTTAR
jgi:hypothetical protein